MSRLALFRLVTGLVILSQIGFLLVLRHVVGVNLFEFPWIVVALSEIGAAVVILLILKQVMLRPRT